MVFFFFSSFAVSELSQSGVSARIIYDDPEFVAPIGNLTTPIGREAVLSCRVEQLGNYKVRIDREPEMKLSRRSFFPRFRPLAADRPTPLPSGVRKELSKDGKKTDAECRPLSVFFSRGTHTTEGYPVKVPD